MNISCYDINNFVITVLGHTMFMLGDYTDRIIEDRYVSLSVRTETGYMIYIKDFESNRIIYMDLDIDDPEYVIKNDKLNIYTRLKRYYDLFGDYHTRRIRSWVISVILYYINTDNYINNIYIDIDNIIYKNIKIEETE